MEPQTKLYMFAIMPPPGLAASIHHIRVDFSERYKFTKALKPPVHITLYNPFKLDIAAVENFENRALLLQQWADKQMPFLIELNNYSFFDSPLHPVVFIDVVKNTRLKQLHYSFLAELKKYIAGDEQDKMYKPHITIGYRDVTPEAFPAIRADYSKRKFKESFLCDAFYLWKHDGTKWQVHHTFMMNGKEAQLSLF